MSHQRKPVKSVRIVLVETSHPGNIGAAARAMKTMQQSELYLVNPKIYPSADCTARAAGADDILQAAVVCDSLETALSGCAMIYATTARDRSIQWPVHEPASLAREVKQSPDENKVAIVFGRERSGLTNEEIDCCNGIVQIPANPDYSSLNLASAVQILCYALLAEGELDANENYKADSNQEALASHEEMQRFYDHLVMTMTEVGFYDPEQPKKLIRRLNRLFNRAQMEQTEVNILRGFLAAVQDKLKR